MIDKFEYVQNIAEYFSVVNTAFLSSRNDIIYILIDILEDYVFKRYLTYVYTQLITIAKYKLFVEKLPPHFNVCNN